MTDLHHWTTPNSHKITIFLEETGQPYLLGPELRQLKPHQQQEPAMSPSEQLAESKAGWHKRIPAERNTAFPRQFRMGKSSSAIARLSADGSDVSIRFRAEDALGGVNADRQQEQ